MDDDCVAVRVDDCCHGAHACVEHVFLDGVCREPCKDVFDAVDLEGCAVSRVRASVRHVCECEAAAVWQVVLEPQPRVVWAGVLVERAFSDAQDVCVERARGVEVFPGGVHDERNLPDGHGGVAWAVYVTW